MKDKYSLLIILFFVLIIILNISCERQRWAWKGTVIGKVVNLTDIKNPRELIYGEVNPDESLFSQSPEPIVVQLFKEYEWTISEKINAFSLHLPSNLLHNAGEFPVKIYWAYNLELSKSIGFDFSGFLGFEVDVEIYKLTGPLPNFFRPHNKTMGVVLKNNETIIGAYIHRGRHYAFGCSLDRKSLEDITGKDWDAWVEKYINYDNEMEMRLSVMEPEEIIREYYEARNKGDINAAMACCSRSYLCIYLFANMDNSVLFNEDYNIESHGDYLSSARLIEIKEWKHLAEINPPVFTYEVKGDFKYSFHEFRDDGIHDYYVRLKKETVKGGWRIISIGTGP